MTSDAVDVGDVGVVVDVNDHGNVEAKTILFFTKRRDNCRLVCSYKRLSLVSKEPNVIPFSCCFFVLRQCLKQSVKATVLRLFQMAPIQFWRSRLFEKNFEPRNFCSRANAPKHLTTNATRSRRIVFDEEGKNGDKVLTHINKWVLTEILTEMLTKIWSLTFPSQPSFFPEHFGEVNYIY